jgi:hypothetical protein
VEPPKERREHPLMQGARYGGVGCVGCLTFAVLGVVVIAVLAHAHAFAGLLILAVVGLALYALVRRPRR